MCGVNLVNSITPPPTHLLKSVRHGWSTKKMEGDTETNGEGREWK